jgi:hypothetical protein
MHPATVFGRRMQPVSIARAASYAGLAMIEAPVQDMLVSFGNDDTYR